MIADCELVGGNVNCLWGLCDIELTWGITPAESWGPLRRASTENGCWGKKAACTPPTDESDIGEENAELFPPVKHILYVIQQLDVCVAEM